MSHRSSAVCIVVVSTVFGVGTAHAQDEPSVEDRLDAIEALAISGYIQAQYEALDTSRDEVDDSGGPLNLDRFSIRRGRLKLEYDGIPHTRFMLQIDATSTGVGLRDAEAGVFLEVDDWTMSLTAGLFKVPFGYEVMQSSSNRVFPERTRFAREFFAGERDLGVRLRVEHERFVGTLAVVNGNPIGGRAFPGRDPNSAKDLVVRFALDLGPLTVGASTYAGSQLVAGHPEVAASTTWLDSNGNQSVDAGELVQTEPEPMLPSENVTICRAGADAQLALPIDGFGDFEAYGEIAVAHQNGAHGGPDTDTLGWHVAIVQHYAHLAGLAFRLQWFDPRLDSEDDAQWILEPAVLLYPAEPVRLSLTYAIALEEDMQIENDAFTARLQVKF